MSNASSEIITASASIFIMVLIPPFLPADFRALTL